MLQYCCGNLKVLELAEFSEISEILDFVVTKENDETLLRAYQASYAALQNIPFSEYKRLVFQKSAGLQSNAQQPTAEKVFEKVEKIIDGYQWEEV